MMAQLKSQLVIDCETVDATKLAAYLKEHTAEIRQAIRDAEQESDDRYSRDTVLGLMADSHWDGRQHISRKGYDTSIERATWILAEYDAKRDG
jgi:hypothetical protein